MGRRDRVGTAEGFAVTEVIGEKAVDQDRLLFLYLGEKGEIDCAAVKKTFGLYRAEAVLGYLPARESGPVESGGSRAHLLYCPYRQQGEWYLCYGVIADQDVANVSFGEQEMEELQYGGVRIVYCCSSIPVLFLRQYKMCIRDSYERSHHTSNVSILPPLPQNVRY